MFFSNRKNTNLQGHPRYQTAPLRVRQSVVETRWNCLACSNSVLRQYVFHEGCYLLSIDGTEYFSSQKIQCQSCLTKVNILGAKPGDHLSLFQEVMAAYDQDRITTLEWQEDGLPHSIAFVNQIPLNSSNPDLLVNYLFYAIHGQDGKIKTCYTWVTDLDITRSNARHLMRGGRSRWKIENETFNTLKNQEYHYEHNFGHGELHLSVVFSMLMMLAFLTDQVQQLCCPLFGAVLEKVRSKRVLWEKLRSHFSHFVFKSMHHLFGVILYDLAKELPAPIWDSS